MAETRNTARHTALTYSHRRGYYLSGVGTCSNVCSAVGYTYPVLGPAGIYRGIWRAHRYIYSSISSCASIDLCHWSCYLLALNVEPNAGETCRLTSCEHRIVSSLLGNMDTNAHSVSVLDVPPRGLGV